MARSFATTDVVVSGSAITLPLTFSICWWAKGTATFGIHWQFASDRIRAYHSSSTQTRIDRQWTGSGSHTSTVTHGLTLANWNSYAWTHDGTTAAPQFYGNGVAVATNAWSGTPTGAPYTTAHVLGMGNKTDGTQVSGVSLGYFSIYNVVLTQGEVIEAMRFGFTPRGLIGFWPLLGDSTEPDYSGRANSGTVTGSTVVSNPPLSSRFVTPAWTSSSSAAAAAPAGHGNLLLLGVG